MKSFQRIAVFFVAIMAFAMIGRTAGQKSPVKGLKKIESTDPALRLKWLEEHTALNGIIISFLCRPEGCLTSPPGRR